MSPEGALALAPPLALEGVILGDALGRGATATVFAAQLGDAAIALKVGHRREDATHLAHEARMLVRGGQPELPRPLGVGWVVVESGSPARPALAFERVEGEPLSARLGGGVASLALAPALAQALSGLHAGGVAHGDLKPDNVVVPRSGELRLIDLGLARDSDDRTSAGGTPRYLGRGDRELGDARCRDLLALGLILAELAEPRLRSCEDLLPAARGARLGGSIGEVCAALLTPNPEARPSAAWVATRLRAASEHEPGAEALHAERRLLAIRNAYARRRAGVLSASAIGGEGAAPWLEPLCAWGRALADLEGLPSAPSSVGPLSRDELVAWIVAVVGAQALSWPLSRLVTAGEQRVARGLSELAVQAPFAAWTLRELTLAVEGSAATAAPRDAAEAPSLIASALALARTPASDEALLAVEADARSAPELVALAARALRLRGELGRALALMSRLEEGGSPRWLAEAAELHRRAGDTSRASALAQRALARAPAEPSARACAARAALDEGDVARALSTIGAPSDALGLEVLALARAAAGEPEAARSALDQAEGCPADDEQRARLLGARGYVLSGHDPGAAYRAFAAAAERAAIASALLEEATYATGAAAAGVDLGYLEQAVRSGERAVQLWDHLGRGPRAARAALNTAAAYDVAGRRAEARTWAELALQRATRLGDARAVAFARCALCDALEPGSGEAQAQARAALELLPRGDPDGLRASARALRHGAVEALDVSAEDDAASHDGRAPGASPGARMEWIAARLGQGGPRAERLLAAACSLADVPLELGARGPMLAAALRAARAAGRGEIALRLAASLRAAADQLLERAGASLTDSCAALDWVRAAREEASGGSELSSEQARRLEQLVRGLSADARLSDLLRGVLDALVAWTGAERGLLLLRGPDGRLIPKVGRNLAQGDLRGPQLALSMSLARRALEQLEPVVAVDAALELPDLHASVHALRLRSVLAVPLVARGDALGVVYLDDRVRRGAFGERELAWVRTLATLAATMVARASSEAKLRRAARQAAHRGRELEKVLAEREARLDAALSSLGVAHARPGSVFEGVVGKSEAIERTIRMAERVASTDVPVLIIGESGSGKELFARAIHAASRRAREPFVSENCGAIPETLLESALFGHVRGAFTGAERSRVGLFAAADGGTLFLDEIGELRLGMQSKLLRVLEDGVVRPLGTEREAKVDVRLIAATNRDLERMVSEKLFRDDLFYRLSVVPLRIPPLRERPEDIPFLVHHFVERHAGGRPIRVTRAALDLLERAEWPGNVRQLENEVRRALVMCDDLIDVEHLTLAERGEADDQRDVGLDVRLRVDRLEAQLVREALGRTNGNQTRAAKLLGLSRFGLQKMMKRLHLRAD